MSLRQVVPHAERAAATHEDSHRREAIRLFSVWKQVCPQVAGQIPLATHSQKRAVDRVIPYINIYIIPINNLHDWAFICDRIILATTDILCGV